MPQFISPTIDGLVHGHIARWEACDLLTAHLIAAGPLDDPIDRNPLETFVKHVVDAIADERLLPEAGADQLRLFRDAIVSTTPESQAGSKA